ncbi:MAG: hypothetical protein K5697_00780 [Lachnospiraceae bacterium]|nr:hypothetical protein [Lachnospiraceae bacterium]
MNKKGTVIFHKGAYRDALHRLLFPTIASGVLLALIETALLIYVNGHVSEMEGASGFIHYTFARLGAPLLSVFLVISPLLLLYLFQFQNRRPGSDCFHSLPISKKSMALSGYAAVLSVDALLLLFGGLWVEGLSALLPHVRMGDENRFFLTLGCFMAAAVFTSALMLLALALSGSALSALCMYAILLVGPRLLLFVWEYSVSEASETIARALDGTVLNRHLNVATSLIGCFLGMDTYDAIKSVSSLLYTLILGLILLGAAVALYGRRPSESAEHPAVNARVQGIFRTALGSVIIIFSVLFTDDMEYKSIAMIVIIALAAYLIYELLLTKSLRSCLRALPGFLYVILCGLLFLAAVWGGRDFMKNDLANPDRVRSISMIFRPGGYYDFPEDEDYYCTSMRDYEIRDKEAVTILCEALRKTEQREYGEHVNGENLELYFDGGVFFKDRIVFVEQDEMERLLTILGKDEAYRDIFLKPAARDQLSKIESFGNRYSGSAPVGDTDALYEVYREAVLKYGEEDFAKAVRWLVMIKVGGMESLRVTFNDGRKQTVYLHGIGSDGIHVSDGEEDAILDAFTDLRTGEGEKDVIGLAYPEGGDDMAETLAMVYVDFCNVTPHFEEGGEVDLLLSREAWCANLILTPQGWDRSKQSHADVIYEDNIFELFRRTRYWNGWEVTDTSAPYIRVRYLIFQHSEGEEGARTLKEFDSCYRLEPEVLEWLGVK